jgi:hypothetical protein
VERPGGLTDLLLALLALSWAGGLALGLWGVLLWLALRRTRAAADAYRSLAREYRGLWADAVEQLRRERARPACPRRRGP